MMRPCQQPRSKHDEARDYSVNCESHSAAWRLIVDNAFHDGPRRVRKPMNDIVAQQIRSAVEARLQELRPVLSELEQLQSVLAVLDDPNADRKLPRASAALNDLELARLGASANVTPLLRQSRHGSKRGRDGRAPQGANKQSILAVVAEHPGIAAPEIATLTGLKRPLVASTISRLKRRGELLAHGDGVRLPSPQTGRPQNEAVGY